ncbi:cadherin-89D [Hyalella azteca]|uniref:Cadherin-89D n=1 Tax=Hyalella azteca TaxID=294128 RepID=A0A979FX02_HYAAZ|nr:cadherin-89D [Hyalella azteca]
MMLHKTSPAFLASRISSLNGCVSSGAFNVAEKFTEHFQSYSIKTLDSPPVECRVSGPYGNSKDTTLSSTVSSFSTQNQAKFSSTIHNPRSRSTDSPNLFRKHNKINTWKSSSEILTTLEQSTVPAPLQSYNATRPQPSRSDPSKSCFRRPQDPIVRSPLLLLMLMRFLLLLQCVLFVVCATEAPLPTTCDWGAAPKPRRFVRVREDAPLGYSILSVNVTRPDLLVLSHAQEGASLFRASAGRDEGLVVVAERLSQLLAEPQAAAAPVIKFSLTCGDNLFTQQVTVYVEDVNDHAPMFDVPIISITVDELTPVGLTVLNGIKTTDLDKPNTANSEVTLSLGGGDPSGYFKMADSKKGIVQLAKTLDYDDGPRTFDIQVIAQDQGSPRLSSSARLLVAVVDADDRPPVFSADTYSVSIPEQPGVDTGSFAPRVLYPEPPLLAADGDEGLNISLVYSILPGPHATAFNADDNERESSSVLEVLVTDVNDNLPEFEHDLYAISIVENLPTGFSVVQVSASDADQGVNGEFRYRLFGGDSALAINPNTGWLTVANHSLLDRETLPTLSLQVCTEQVAPLVSSPHVVMESTTSISRRRQTLPIDVPAATPSHFTNLPSTTTAETSQKLQVSEAPPLSLTKLNARTFIPSDRDLTVPIVTQHSSEVKTKTRAFPTVIIRKSESSNSSLSPSPEIRDTFSIEDAIPKLETLPFGTRTAPRKASRSSAVRRLDASKSSSLSEPLSEISAMPLISSATTEIHINKSSSEVTFLKGKRLEMFDLSDATTKLSKNSSISDVNSRKKRNSDAFNKFNTRRHAKPKSLVPIKLISNQNLSVSGEVLERPGNYSCAAIQLTLLDANDNNPVFLPSNQYHFTVRQDAKPGMRIGRVEAIDADSGMNGHVTYRLQDRTTAAIASHGNVTSTSTDNERKSAIIVESNTGYLTLNSAALKLGEFTMFVEASDSPASVSETRTSLAVVVISVTAGDAWEPRFEGAPFEFWVGGDASVGTSVGQVRVADLDRRRIFFDMFHSYEDGVPFAIEETSGIVSVVEPLAGFDRSDYQFEAVVTDGQASLVTNLSVHVAPQARSPQMSEIVLLMSVQENLAGGLVGNIRTELKKQGIDLPPEPRLDLVSPETREVFVIAQDSSLYTAAALDHETRAVHGLAVLSASSALIFYINVQVEDVNDNPPQLNAVSYEGSLGEDSLPGTPVLITPRIEVTDLDSYPGSSWELRLLGSASALFAMNASTGSVYFRGGHLDRESIAAYGLLIQAIDDGNLTTYANLTIKLEDVNDNYPIFRKSNEIPQYATKIADNDIGSRGKSIRDRDFTNSDGSTQIIIPESLSVGSKVTQVVADDKDVGLFADIRYLIESQTSYHHGGNSSAVPQVTSTNTFSLEPKSGNLVVAGKLLPDHLYVLNISAIDGGGLSTMTVVSVNVYDVNDHAPQFLLPVYYFDILEGSYLVGEVGGVTAVDLDLGENSKIMYQIVVNESPLTETFPFRIGETSGMILATGQVDREMQSRYQFSVIATDGGEPPLSTSVEVHISVSDSNDHDPIFYGYQTIYSGSERFKNYSLPVYQITVPENLPKGTIITKVFANDSDSMTSGNGIVLYKIEEPNSPFGIDSKNGSIFTAMDLDYETSSSLRATVVAIDVGTPTRSASALLDVTVTDVREDLADRLFDVEQYVVQVKENSEVPVPLLNLSGSFARLSEQGMHFLLADTRYEDLVSVDTESGQVYLIKSLDREEQHEYKFKIRALAPLEIFRSSESRREEIYTLATTTKSVTVPTTQHTTYFTRSSGLRATTELPSVAKDDKLNPFIEPRRRKQPITQAPAYPRTDKWRSSRRDSGINGRSDVAPSNNGENSEDDNEASQRKGRSFHETNIEEDLIMSASLETSINITNVNQSVAEFPISVEGATFGNEYSRKSTDDFSATVEKSPLEPNVNISQMLLSNNHHLEITTASNGSPKMSDTHSKKAKRSALNESGDTRRISLTQTSERDFGARISEGIPVNLIDSSPRLHNHLSRTQQMRDVEAFSASTLQLNEVWVVIKVLDENDNPPRFNNDGRPLVGAVLSDAIFGHEIFTIEATDPDAGPHGAVRFTMLQSGPADLARHKFAVDSLTGRVTVVGDLRADEGRMFGFDVRATDNAGQPDGLSAVTNVFVSIILRNFRKYNSSMLSNATGLDVRVQRIAPHHDSWPLKLQASSQNIPSNTDLYVYGVSTTSQEVVAAALLKEALSSNMHAIVPRGLSVKGLRTPQVNRESALLQTPELAILISVALVLLITVTALVCLCHKQRKRRRKTRPSPFTGGLSGAAGGGMSVLPLSFPVGPLPYAHMSDRSSASSEDLTKAAFRRPLPDRLSKLRQFDDHAHFGEFHLRKNRSYMVGRKKSIHDSRRRRSKDGDLCERIHSHTAELQGMQCCATFSSSGANSDEDGLPVRRRKSPRRNFASSGNSDCNDGAFDSPEFRRSRQSRNIRRHCCADSCPSHNCCRNLAAVDCSTTTTATTVTSPQHLRHFRNNSPDSLERNPHSHHNHHHHQHLGGAGDPHHHHHRNHHHSSLHSLSQHQNHTEIHGSTPALPTYPYPGPVPPPAPPMKPSKPNAFKNEGPVITIPRTQLRRPQCE